MTLLYEGDLKSRGHSIAERHGAPAEEILGRLVVDHDRYDIFLSQTIRDAEIVLGVFDLLTSMGFVVFVDWIVSPSGDTKVVPANADFIRHKLSMSDTLLFLDTPGAAQSLWMCWEIGWFDGRVGLVAVLPAVDQGVKRYQGREFLGLYPYIELDDDGQLQVYRPVVTAPNGRSMFEAPNSRSFENWRKRPLDPMRPRTPGYDFPIRERARGS